MFFIPSCPVFQYMKHYVTSIYIYIYIYNMNKKNFSNMIISLIHEAGKDIAEGWIGKTILILNWNFWNRTVYMYKNEFGINNLQWLMCYKTKTNQTNIYIVLCTHVLMYIFVNMCRCGCIHIHIY